MVPPLPTVDEILLFRLSNGGMERQISRVRRGIGPPDGQSRNENQEIRKGGTPPVIRIRRGFPRTAS